MKTLIKILTLAFILNAQFSYSQYFDWATGSSGGVRNNGGKAIETDVSGNVLSAGEFKGTIDLGGIILTSTGDNDIYIAKHNSSGVIQWAQSISGSDSSNVNSIACSSNGDVYLLANISLNFILTKLNTDGIIQWTENIDQGTILSNPFSFNNKNSQKISVDNSGDCFILGTFGNSATVGSTNLISAGSNDVFLAKYNSSGIFQWVKSGGGINYDVSAGIATDVSGNVLITGHFISTAQFGNISLSSTSSGYSTFIVKYNSDGTELSGISTDGTGDCYGYGIGTDDAENIYISGFYSGNITFGTLSISGGHNNFFIAKYNNSGIIDWVKNEDASQSYFTSGNVMKTNSSGNSFVYGSYYGLTSFDGFTLTGKGSYIVKYNNAGMVQSLTQIISEDFGYNTVNGIAVDGDENSYITGGYNLNSHFGNHVLTSSGKSIFIAKTNNVTNHISGNLFIDYDNDGILDIGEPPYPGKIVSAVSENLISISDLTGYYNMFCGQGNFNFNISNPPLYYTINPGIHNINFTTYGNSIINKNFGLYPAPGKNDLKITLTENSRAVKGFDMTHNITYENIGTTTQSGTVQIIYDANLTYLPALTNPTPTRADPVNHKLEWDYVNLAPIQIENIRIGYNLPATVPLGSILSSAGKISSSVIELTPSDNVATLNQTVVASFDPNDKSVSPSGGITLQQVLNEDPLTYTIRFQNTGTYHATTVILMDTLSPNLNASTIEVLSASHDYSLSVSGNGSLRWTFDNIMLPDKNSNEPLSHGFIKYRVKPKNNLVIGDEIKNTAYIFFDYNEPVITNTTVTQVEASKDIQINWRSEGMFPNSDATVIQLRRAVAPYDIIKTAAGVSATPFIIPPIYTLTATVNNLLSGSYYFVIKHRNSIETWSANPVTITPNGTTYYDFTTSQSKALGNNMVQTGTVWSVYSGDINQDGIIDATDLTEVENGAANSLSGYINCDLTGDNFVDATDLAIVENNSALGVSFVSP